MKEVIGRVEIIIGGKELNREVWTFSLIREAQLKLTRYVFQTRETKRHGWKTQTEYDFYDKRHQDIQQPPITDDMKELAKKKFMEMIEVC